MTAYECQGCGATLWLADSRRVGRCLECRHIAEDQRLRDVIAEQQARLGRRKAT